MLLEKLGLEELSLVEANNGIVVADELTVDKEEGVDASLATLFPDGLAELGVLDVKVDDLGVCVGVSLDDGEEAGGLLGDEHTTGRGSVDDDVLAHCCLID